MDIGTGAAGANICMAGTDYWEHLGLHAAELSLGDVHGRVEEIVDSALIYLIVRLARLVGDG